MSNAWQNNIIGHEVWSASQFLANPKNYKLHPRNQQDATEASINDLGWVKSVTVNARTGLVLDGHLRVTLALRKGDDTPVPVELVDLPEHLEAEALLILDQLAAMGMQALDNSALESLLREVSTGEEALQTLISGIAEEHGLLDALNDGTATGAGGDEFDATPDESGPTRTQKGDLWLIDGGKHRLICGDSTDQAVVARLLTSEKPFMMVTDPPYGVEYDQEWRSNNRTGKVTNDDRCDWKDAYRLSGADVVYCWHASLHTEVFKQDLEACDFEVRAQIIWSKHRMVFSQGHYHWKHEPCWYGVRKGATARWTGDRTQTTVWEMDIDPDVDGGHSTQKPLECMARPIRNHGEAGDLVYDPFLGSGTTLIAAHRTGRRCYGCEIEPKYADVILRRAEAEGLTVELAEREGV